MDDEKMVRLISVYGAVIWIIVSLVNHHAFGHELKVREIQLPNGLLIRCWHRQHTIRMVCRPLNVGVEA
jgi:hypothetical protein